MVFEDNKQLTELLANGMKKCKQFMMMVAYIKEQVSKRLITIEKIPTKLNPEIYCQNPRMEAILLIIVARHMEVVVRWISMTQCKLLGKMKTKK
jgi:hypothetical protein